jgi:hypothetical protein
LSQNPQVMMINIAENIALSFYESLC